MADESLRDRISTRSSFVFSLFATKLSCLTVSLVYAFGYWNPSPCAWLSHAPSTMIPLTSRSPFPRFSQVKLVSELQLARLDGAGEVSGRDLVR